MFRGRPRTSPIMEEPGSAIIVVAVIAVLVLSIVAAALALYTVGRVVRRVFLGVAGAADGIGRLVVGGPPRPQLPPAPVRYSADGRRRRWPPLTAAPAMLRCPRPRCHAENVPSAKFCRRCGAGMDERVAVGRRPDVGRAAMW
jgi:hypothetical protein